MITLIVPFEAEADATGRRRQCKPSGFVKIRGSGGRGCAVRAWSNDYSDQYLSRLSRRRRRQRGGVVSVNPLNSLRFGDCEDGGRAVRGRL